MLGRLPQDLALNWIKLLAEVASLEALLVLVNDYVLQFPDEYWTWIPRGARPGLVSREEDIHFWHRRLVEEMGKAAAPNIRLQDLSVFFVRASARALELHPRNGHAAPSNDRAFNGHSNGGKTTD